MKKDNQGFTLVELIVVILIMAVLAAGTMIGVNTLYTGSAQSTTERIKSMLDFVRTEHMSKEQNYYLAIEEDEGNYYLMEIKKDNSDEAVPEEIVVREKLDLKQGEISYWDETMSESDPPILVHTDPVAGRNTDQKLAICFSKDSGNFISYREHLSDVTAKPIVTAIKIEAMSRTYMIRLVKETGKYYIE